MNKYLKYYEWSNIGAMLRNSRLLPKEVEQDFTGRLVVITGATSGIGHQTARLYASRGADILCINRSVMKSESLKAEIMRDFGVEISFYITDFSHLSEVHTCADMLADLPKDISVLIHNAGVFNTKKIFTQDKLEEVFQVDYLASFIITHRLIVKLRAQDRARIIFVNSEGHRFAIEGFKPDDLAWNKRHYTGLRSYGSAKTAQLLAMICFVETFKGSGVTINAMHPGDVKTNMGENNGRIYRFFKHRLINPTALDPRLSAQALYYLGVSPELDGITGKFWNFTTEEIPAPHSLDHEMARIVWDLSLDYGGLC